ncbi:oligosaccharide flippase family protein [Flavobacteriaceae bacterium]|nr:oligosaccharide flippase family protein [Flavobacteriaceae bacterium]
MSNYLKLSSRVLFKIGANIFTLIFNLIFSFIVPRTIGPAGYGVFELINSNINQLMSFIDLGSSSAFYAKLSKRPNDLGLIQFYFKIILYVIVPLGFIFLIVISLFNFTETINDDKYKIYIFLAFIYGFGLHLSTSIRNATDAYALTAKSEMIVVAIKALGILIIIFLFFTNRLTIISLYFKEIFIVTLIILGNFLLLKKLWNDKYSKDYIISNTKSLKKEFWNYSHPLLIMSIGVSLGLIAERWILQIFSGSVEQGFYSFGFRISSIAMIFAGAVSSLLVREVSISFNNNDFVRLKVLMEKSIKLMYVFVSIIVSYGIIFSEEIIILFAGEDYSGAVVTVQIILIYPLHQIIGQYVGSFFLGAGKTKLYRNITLFASALGLLTAWFLIAPPKYFGLDLGSVGLAIRMVIVNILISNISLFYVVKSIKSSYLALLYHQIAIFTFFISLSYLCSFLTKLIFLNSIYIMLFTGFSYFLLSVFIIYKRPSMIGFTKTELNIMRLKIYSYFN